MTISERAKATIAEPIQKADKCPTCGQTRPKRPRSIDDHRRFFGVISAAFQNWPEAHEFQPDSKDHLRSWLLCKAGHRDVTTVPVESDDPALRKLVVLAVEGSIKAARSHAFIRPHGSAIAVFTARSINFETLDQKQFAPLRETVEQIIEAETGIKADDLLKNEDPP
jgi:hypothetical protein